MSLDEFFQNNPEWREFADLIAMPPSAQEVCEEYPDFCGELVQRGDEVAKPMVSRLAIYVRSRRQGNDHRMAELFSLQRFPGVETNDTFWGGRKHFSEVYGENYAADVKRRLKARGINLHAGVEYMPELARFRGDPEAVVPFGSGRSYIKRLCQRRGWGCEGAVNVNAREPDHDLHTSGKPLGEDIIGRNAREMVQKDPALRRKSRQEIREMVIEKHGPK